MDNERNWRFRLELTEQLGQLVVLSLFSASDIREYLAPMATQLVQDKVSSVRVAATTVLSDMLFKLHSLGHPILATSLASSLVEVLGRSPHWAKRQTYAVLCGAMIRQAGDSAGAFSPANFSSELLPHLLDLAWDKVGLLSENNYSVQTKNLLAATLSLKVAGKPQADIYHNILRFYLRWEGFI